MRETAKDIDRLLLSSSPFLHRRSISTFSDRDDDAYRVTRLSSPYPGAKLVKTSVHIRVYGPRRERFKLLHLSLKLAFARMPADYAVARTYSERQQAWVATAGAGKGKF